MARPGLEMKNAKGESEMVVMRTTDVFIGEDGVVGGDRVWWW